MKPFKRRSYDAYLRLVSLFEKELKNYHPIFQKDYYSIHYIISREQYTNDSDVTILFKIQRKVLWFELRKEPKNLKEILESYSKYFSITKVIISKPYEFNKRNDLSRNLIVPIQERVSFELFKSPCYQN